MHKLVLCLIVFCFIEIAMADIVITEVMYNPGQCDDYDCEWIELYNTDSISVNLTGWILDGESLDGIVISAHEYIVLADELIDGNDADNESFESYWGNNDGVWNPLDGNFDAYDISLSLKNTEDSIILTDSTYTDTLNYSSSWGANGNDYTLEKINPDGANTQENWAVGFVMNGTPGMQNSIYGTGEIDYSVITINEFLPDPHGDDNAPMPQGEWIELYNSGSQNINLKWAFLEDLQGHKVYIADTTTVDTTIIPANGFLVIYTNGFSGLLNNGGIEELRFYDKEDNLIDSVSYEGSDEGSSWANVIDNWQRTMPTPEGENMDYTKVKDSKFDIDTIYDLGSDDVAKFGQTIRVKVNLYKGDETKSVLRMWIADGDEKISKESKITISTKYTNVSLAVPIQLYPNCNEKYDDGDYDIFIGWTSEDFEEDSFPLEVEDITDSLCEIVKVEKSSTTSAKKFEYNLVSNPDEIKSGEEFDIRVELNNHDDEDYDIDIWSYVYKGNKAYSGGREDNKKSFVLEKGSSETIKLRNTVDAAPGDYNLKIKIIKNNQKTAKEITNTLRVIEEVSEGGYAEGIVGKASGILKWREAFVYESTSFKAKNLVPLLFIILLSLFVIILIFTKN
ncbi:MAG: lamin tail domain-containing protein [Candidatus Woesearchaeota archaeon]